MSKDALSKSLKALSALDLLERNPGYGHPLRPEYVLTKRGQRVARPCARYQDLAETFGVVPVAYRKWSAPLLLTIRTNNTRFRDIQSAIGEISPRSLTEGLKGLREASLVSRSVEDGYPPGVSYRLRRKGTRMAAAAYAIHRRGGHAAR